MANKKLIRPKEGRVLFGVSAGLGNYFDVDPIIIRIIFIVLTIWGGAGIILYIIGIFLMPSENKSKDNFSKPDKEEIKQRVEAVAEEIKQTSKDRSDRNRGGVVFGLIVLLIGLIFLSANFFPYFGWGKMWPLILIIFGILILAGGTKTKK